jgi:hypothetical protein
MGLRAVKALSWRRIWLMERKYELYTCEAHEFSVELNKRLNWSVK